MIGVVLPASERFNNGLGEVHVCFCGCTMIWSSEVHQWLCLHCDLDEDPDEH